MMRSFALALVVSVALTGADAGESSPTGVALVRSLADLEAPDLGYSGVVSGSAFLPYDFQDDGPMLLMQPERRRSSTVMRTLVAGGVAMLPDLIAGLADQRPVSALKPVEAIMWMQIADEYDYNALVTTVSPPGVNRLGNTPAVNPRPGHQITVADLCFVAIGQIVNRTFSASRYQPSGGIVINSPSRTPALRDAVMAEWSGLTPLLHRQRLEDDFRVPDYPGRRAGAAMRLAFYYPEALPALVIPYLRTPTIDVFIVEAFVRDLLYKAEPARDQEQIAAFVAKHGAQYKEGVLKQLFFDLDWSEATEERRGSPPAEFGARPRQVLVHALGFPPGIRSTQAPRWIVDEASDRARFIKQLIHDRDPGITEEVRGILRQTEDDYLALNCFHRLIITGHADDILAYCRRRQAASTTWKPELTKALAAITQALQEGRPLGRDLLPETM